MSVPKLRFPGFAGDWEEKRLGDVAPNPSYGLNAAAKKFDGKHKYIRITDIDENTRKFIPKPVTSPQGDIPKSYRLAEGDLLFARTGAGTGRSYLYDSADGEVYFAGFLVRFRVTKAEPSFVFAQTLRSHFDKWIVKTSMRSGQPGVNAKEYSSLTFDIPTLPEQQKIAAFLGAVDAKLAALAARQAALGRFKAGLMQKLFSQQLRFTRDGGRAFPDWQELPFEKIASRVRSAFNPQKSTDKPTLIELENIEGETGKIVGHSDLDGQVSLKSIFRADDVLFGKLRPYLRKYARPNFDGVCSSEIWVLRGRKVSNAFLFYLVQSSLFIQVANISTGSKMPRSDWATIADTGFEIPHPDEQAKIANALSAMDAKIRAVADQIAGLEAFKKGLLQQMFV